MTKLPMHPVDKLASTITTIPSSFSYMTSTSANSNEVLLSYKNQLVFAGSSQDFINKVYERPDQVIAVLAEAIISLRRTQRYNGVYTAYLLGQLDDDEFSAEAEKYSFEPDECYSDEIRSKTEILINAINENVSASEISDIFKVEVGVAEQILSAISDKSKAIHVGLNDN